METFSVDWHKEALKNSLAYLAGEEKRLARMQTDINNIKEKIEFYQLQIKEAERLGKKSFDPDRFLKNKKTKGK